jgi:DNA-binding transcriptional regulator YdaS (Cro superfamily)
MLLKDYIKNSKITVSGLALKAKCGQPMLSLICLGERRPSPDLALKIEWATNGAVTRDELLFPELYQSQSQQHGQDKAE